MSDKQKQEAKQLRNPRMGILFTGFPGFIGSRLVKRLVDVWPDAVWNLLTTKQARAAAEKEAAQIIEDCPSAKGQLALIEGDVSEPGLGIDEKTAREMKQNVAYAFHLAATHHLGASREKAFKINLGGTTNVLDFVAQCRGLRRLVYFSSCSVSGRRLGLIKEDELETGQEFKNFYEESKFRAEVEVRRRMEYIPTVIIRPPIVVGDSRTGETSKYDGLYYMFQIMKYLPVFVTPPMIGKMNAYLNIAPVDYIVEGTATLAQRPESAGRTFHLADPRPLTSGEIYKIIAGYFGNKTLPAKIPDKPLIKLAGRFPKLWETINFPPQLLEYLNHDARYDTANARAFLEPLGIACPYFPDYFDKLADYYMAHPEIKPPKIAGEN